MSKIGKSKRKMSKLMEISDSEDELVRELGYFSNDRVKLMKEVLKIIPAKKIKSMAPDSIQDLDIEEVNTMLLEELLGISNKRLKYILNGQNDNEDSSSSESEQNDVISLDEISDSEFIIDLDSDKERLSKKKKHNPKPIKEEKRIKKEDKRDSKLQEENLMSVLELLELQARARAIKSQIILESTQKNDEEKLKNDINNDDDDDIDAVIIQDVVNDEIFINSSDDEVSIDRKKDANDNYNKKIVVVENKIIQEANSDSKNKGLEKSIENVVEICEKTDLEEGKIETYEKSNLEKSKTDELDKNNDDSVIVINVDETEMIL